MKAVTEGAVDESTASQRNLRSDAKASRARLLAAAKAVVGEEGLDALTVVAVAKRAGLNRSTAYQHFPQREDLVEAVGAQFARELRALLSEPRDLGDQIDFFVHYFHRNPDIARIWMDHLMRDGTRVSSPGWDEYVGALSRLAESDRSQDGIDAEMLSLIAMTSSLVWSIMSRARSDDPDGAMRETDRFARELKRLFLHGALRPEAWPELVAQVEGEGDG